MKSWWHSFSKITDPALFEDELMEAIKLLATDVQARDGDGAEIQFLVLMARANLRSLVCAAAMGAPDAQLELLALGLAVADDFKVPAEPTFDEHLERLDLTDEIVH